RHSPAIHSFPYTTLFRSNFFTFLIPHGIQRYPWISLWVTHIFDIKPVFSYVAVTAEEAFLVAVVPVLHLCVEKVLKLFAVVHDRSEEHTSELQSREKLVC